MLQLLVELTKFNTDKTPIQSEIESNENVISKQNVIVIGDGEGDINMIDKSNYANVYSIGFFNMLPDETHYAERLTHFQTIYDTVLAGDAGLEQVIEILNFHYDKRNNLSDETLESLKQFKNKEFDVYTSLEDMWADVRAI